MKLVFTKKFWGKFLFNYSEYSDMSRDSCGSEVTLIPDREDIFPFTISTLALGSSRYLLPWVLQL
jgi:hypothetical protein